MTVVTYFSEATWGGWTLVVAGKDVLHVGDIIEQNGKVYEVRKSLRIAKNKLGETSQLVWLSPNEHVCFNFNIGDHLEAKK